MHHPYRVDAYTVVDKKQAVAFSQWSIHIKRWVALMDSCHRYSVDMLLAACQHDPVFSL